MALKDTIKIIVKVLILKLNGGHPQRTYDKVINNAKHIPKSPKLTTIAESMKATNFNDKGRDNKYISEAINCNFLNINHLPTTVNEVQNIANPLKSKNSYQYN